ncbi:MAG: hypothetical protein ACM3WV_04345 [Bacillota bacterium]
MEDLWDRSGKTRHGYIDPDEMAREVVEEALQPYRKIKKFQNPGMYETAK